MLTRAAIFAKAAMAVATVLALTTVAQGQDSARGRALAQQRCVECHNIDGGPRGRRRSAPSFREIARQESVDADQLAITLTYNHIPMGDGRVSAGEAGDLAAYIISLRRR